LVPPRSPSSRVWRRSANSTTQETRHLAPDGGLDALITPVHAGDERPNTGAESEPARPRRLTPEEQRRGLAAMERPKALSDEILAERGGKPVSPSWQLINEARRDERSRQLG
jgi:hypothetical protein